MSAISVAVDRVFRSLSTTFAVKYNTQNVRSPAKFLIHRSRCLMISL
jgi:hypothetical protein